MRVAQGAGGAVGEPERRETGGAARTPAPARRGGRPGSLAAVGVSLIIVSILLYLSEGLPFACA